MASSVLERGRRAMRGLTEQQRAILGRRLDGEAFSAIAADEGLTRQRVEQLERSALAALAKAARRPAAGLSVARILQSGRGQYALDGAIGLVPDAGMGQVRGAAMQVAPRTVRERVADRLDDLATAMLREAEQGELSADRRAWYAERAARVAV
jgi:Sigma-70, region 4